MRIKNNDESSLKIGKLVSRDAYEDQCAWVEAHRGKTPTWEGRT